MRERETLDLDEADDLPETEGGEDLDSHARHAATVRELREARRKLPRLAYHRRPWTSADVKLLEFLWGEFDVVQVARRLRRTPIAVQSKAAKMRLRARSEAVLSLRQAVRRSGYEPYTLRRAARELGMVLAHAPRIDVKCRRTVRTLAIPEEQLAAICAYLEKPRPWGKSRDGKIYEACLECHRTDRRYISRGLCSVCNNRHFLEARMSVGTCACGATFKVRPYGPVRQSCRPCQTIRAKRTFALNQRLRQQSA